MSTLHPAARTVAALTLVSLLIAPASALTPAVPTAPMAQPDANAPRFAPAIWPSAASADAFVQPRAALHRAPDANGQPTPWFHAPSASSCQRSVRTHEEPGTRASEPHLTIGSAAHIRRRATAAGAKAPAVLGAPVAAAADGASAELVRPAPMSTPMSTPMPKPQSAEPRQRAAGNAVHAPEMPVTAGMVDDNANFAEYLAFRDRTQVKHRARDVRSRVLLQVRDAHGAAVPDAEVAVRASSGAAMWARTDAGGRAWIAPDAFDHHASSLYEVTARQGKAQASAVFQRGQHSALNITLNAAAPAARARLDLVFLIDATGSMGDEIAKLKATLRTIADEVARLPSRPDTCFGLVAYRDQTDAFLLRSHDFTNDLNAFQRVLDQLQAGGGGDEPEAMNEALFEAVHALSWRGAGATRLLVLLADAAPHLDYPGPQYDESMMAALGKGIKVFSVGASGLNPQGEYIQRQIAQYTGGRFVFLTYNQAGNSASGPGRETVHDVHNYSVDTLDRLIVRLIGDELAQLPHAAM